MELCTSDPPPWIALRDHSSPSFHRFYCPALSPRPPPSTPPMKVRDLSVCSDLCACFTRVCARCAPHTVRVKRMRRCEARRGQRSGNKLESGAKQGTRGGLIPPNVTRATLVAAETGMNEVKGGESAPKRAVDAGRHNATPTSVLLSLTLFDPALPPGHTD